MQIDVYKFGGTSVGTPEGLTRVAGIIDNGEPKIIVLSALSGMTNALERLFSAIQSLQPEKAQAEGNRIRESYAEFIAKLLPSPEHREKAWDAVQLSHRTIDAKIGTLDGSEACRKEILAQGELISTRLFHLYLESLGQKASLLSALDFMRIDHEGQPDLEYIQSHLAPLLEKEKGLAYFITQGYICRNPSGAIDNLKRGGSDYTATLIAAAVHAREIQIWTDIDGLHNNDPRLVRNTRPVRQLSYREAAELAYFGAKILHPTCVIPAEKKDIPLRLKNTFAPEAPGTLISREASGSGIAAIAAKDGITAIRIQSSRMLNAYGFMRRVFQVFEDFQAPIDMITTSEVAVSLTLDDDSKLLDILEVLSGYGEVRAETDQAIICLVGDQLGERKGYAKRIFSALEDVPIRAVSYGGSMNNVTILVHARHKETALLALHRELFLRQTKDP